MNAKRLLTALTVLNLALLVALLARTAPVEARGDGAVLRGRALEIVDEQGRPRASIRIHPAGRTPDGKAYPDTVVLRLIDPAGRPEVKLAASERGGGLGLVGASDTTHALLEAEGAEAVLRLTSADGRQQRIAP